MVEVANATLRNTAASRRGGERPWRYRYAVNRRCVALLAVSVAVVLGLSLNAAPASATRCRYTPPGTTAQQRHERHLRSSDVAFVGTVVDLRETPEHRFITLSVERPLKGSLNEAVTITARKRGVIVGTPNIESGRWVIYADESNEGTLVVGPCSGTKQWNESPTTFPTGAAVTGSAARPNPPLPWKAGAAGTLLLAGLLIAARARTRVAANDGR